MAIAYTGLTSGSSGTDGTGYSTASISPSANALILVAVHGEDADGSNGDAPSSLSGNGLTWVKVDDVVFYTGYNNISLWRSMGASPSTGAITITFPNNENWCAWSVVEFTGVDTSGSNGSGAVVQSANNTGTSASLTVTLSAFSDASNATYGAFADFRDLSSGTNTFTVGTGFTQAHAVNDQIGYRQDLGTEYLLGNDTSVDGSFSSVDNIGAIAIEIKIAAAGGSTYPARLTLMGVS